jgi:hypothetical protein
MPCPSREHHEGNRSTGNTSTMPVMAKKAAALASPTAATNAMALPKALRASPRGVTASGAIDGTAISGNAVSVS